MTWTRVAAVMAMFVAILVFAGRVAAQELKPAPSDGVFHVSGRVLLPDDLPAVRAEVVGCDLDAFRAGGIPSGERGEDLTNADGTFSLAVPSAPRGVRVRVALRGYEAVEVVLPPDTSVERTETVIRLVRLPFVRGTVRSALGKDVAGTRVQVAQRMGERHWRVGRDGAVVAADGRFEVPIHAEAPSKGPGGMWDRREPEFRNEFVVVAELTGHAVAVSAPFELPPVATPREVDLRLDAGEELRARITSAESGAPVAGATVELSPAIWFAGADWLAKLPSHDRPIVTAADGTFVVTGLPPMRYRASVLSPGFARDPHEFDVPSASPVEIALLSVGSIKGVVVDTAGRPVVGARVALLDLADRETPTSSFVAADGTFALADVSKTGHRVAVAPPEIALALDLIPVDAGPFTPGGEPVRITLARGETLTGEILDVEGSRAGSYLIHARREPGGDPDAYSHLPVRLGSPGTFVVHRVRPGGTYRLHLHALGIAFTGVAAGTPAHLRIPGSMTVVGHLVDPAGNPCNGGELEARPVGTDPSSPHVVHVERQGGSFGVFVLMHLAAGRYELTMTRPAWSGDAKARWTLPPGTVVEAGATDATIVCVPADPPPPTGGRR